MLGLQYVMGVTGQGTAWPPGHAPRPPAPYSGRRAAHKRQRLGEARHERPLLARDVAFGLDPVRFDAPLGHGQKFPAAEGV